MAENLLPINCIAAELGIAENYLEYYGRYTAKLRLELLNAESPMSNSKLILVTAITPTQHGEGKTVVSIGLAQALEQRGKKAIVTLREPSLGPIFGEKGGATGGGNAQVLPSEKINLNFNGDFPAVTAAHNLLAALIDAHIHHGNELNLDINNIYWPRVLDINDRALRHVIVGLGGKTNGVPRESEFIITAASEIMAILALANSRDDLRERLSNIVIGLNQHGDIVHAAQLKATGALMVLLNEALMPNLVQTSEHTPALIHTGPFANIAHGTSSVICQKMASRLAEFVINETGFGADLGLEKYCDIVMPSSGLKPAAVVLVVSFRALAAHQPKLQTNNSNITSVANLQLGFENLAKHVENLRRFNLPTVIAINRFPSDTDADLELIKNYCQDLGVACSVVEVFENGGRGAIDLADKVASLTESGIIRDIIPLYSANTAVEEKISIIAKQVYGARSINVEPAAARKLQKIITAGFGYLPICMAKTQSSFSDNPKLTGAPKDWNLTVTDVRLAAGAGFIVVVAGNMLLMPGLSKNPNAFRMDVDRNGRISY